MPQYLGLTAGILKDKKLPSEYCYRLAKMHEKAKRKKEMGEALTECIARFPPNTKPEALIDITQMFIKAQDIAGAARTLQVYLKLRPKDWKAWLDLSKMQASALKNPKEAILSLQKAVQLGGNQVLQIVSKDGTLAPLLKQVSPQQGRPPAKKNNNLNKILQSGRKPGTGQPFGPRK